MCVGEAYHDERATCVHIYIAAYSVFSLNFIVFVSYKLVILITSCLIFTEIVFFD